MFKVFKRINYGGSAAAEGNQKAQLGVDMECHRLRKYIGAYVTLSRYELQCQGGIKTEALK